MYVFVQWYFCLSSLSANEDAWCQFRQGSKYDKMGKPSMSTSWPGCISFYEELCCHICMILWIYLGLLASWVGHAHISIMQMWHKSKKNFGCLWWEYNQIHVSRHENSIIIIIIITWFGPAKFYELNDWETSLFFQTYSPQYIMENAKVYHVRADTANTFDAWLPVSGFCIMSHPW